MPPKKSKLKKLTSISSKSNEKNVEEGFKHIDIKLEATEDTYYSQQSPSKLDLNKFKFEKKPHVKIEFEKDSSVMQQDKGLWEPPNWKEFLINLRIMRANNDAPVDSMGCHMNMAKEVTPEVYRYQCLISLMLSSQTKDQVTFAAMERLRSKGLNVDNVLAMSDDELGKLIYPVGFWKTKVKYIKKTTQTLKDMYKSDIPDSVDKLCKLTGVGPKMAHICMLVAWNKVTGIGVDTHVHRISNRIGWVKKPTNTPEDTRKALQTWLPFDLWSEVNHLLVGFGQTICLPIGPFCHECLNRDICPSSGKGRKSPRKTPVKQEIKIESDDEKPVLPTIRRVTPRKELNDCDTDKGKKEALKRKVTPKKEINCSNMDKSGFSSTDTVIKKPSKIKVTPKKESDSDNTLKIDLNENTNKLSVASGDKTKKEPIKRKITPKKDRINSDDDFEDEIDKPTVKHSRVPKKVTKKKTIEVKENAENVDADCNEKPKA